MKYTVPGNTRRPRKYPPEIPPGSIVLAVTIVGYFLGKKFFGS
jgi:hypothetical protein